MSPAPRSRPRGRRVALVATAFLACAALLVAQGDELSFVCADASCRTRGALLPPDRGGEIVLENLDAGVGVTPYLRREGWPDLRSNRRILASILRPQMSPEARALAIWEFVRHWRFSCAPYSEQSQQLHDPVKLVNVFGCGLCDDSNAVLASLAELAGMPARLWGLTGHVVAEVSYDGAWHMLDAADGVYFRDGTGAIVGVESLARQPDLVVSSTNRELRRAGASRMAQLIRHGAGPVAGGQRAAVRNYFGNRYRGFLQSRGERLPPADPLDPRELDRIVFARYAEIVATTGDNALSQWWNTGASGHEMALVLRARDRLVFSLRPVGEALMTCYVGADDCFEASGRLERASLTPLLQLDPGSGKAVVAERLPYAVEAISLDASALPPGTWTDVFLAFEGGDWIPLGSLAATAAAEPERKASLHLEYRLPPGGEPRFAFRLRFLRRGPVRGDPTVGLRLSTDFRVAAKSLPWPAPGVPPVVVETGAGPPFAGLRVTFRRSG